MFIYSFIGANGLTICNYIKIFIYSYWNVFCLYQIIRHFGTNRKKHKKKPKGNKIFRRFPERRTGKDRRKIFGLNRFFHNGPERRKALRNRRSREERRDGWVRTSKWSTVNLRDLKISKYL
jgi:hypothetical protein